MAKDIEVTQDVSKTEPTKKTQVLKVLSRFRYPVKLSYDNETIFIPPQGTVNLDPSKLEGDLPAGLQSQLVEV